MAAHDIALINCEIEQEMIRSAVRDCASRIEGDIGVRPELA